MTCAHSVISMWHVVCLQHLARACSEQSRSTTVLPINHVIQMPQCLSGFVNHDYYVNPICCVATVCHQVHCMYWGYLGHFHRAISHLKLYKFVCMRYLARIFSQMKSINMLSMFFCNLGFPDILFGDLLQFEYITSLFSCLCMSMLTSNSSRNMQKHGYLGCFMLCLPGKIYLGFG